MKEILMKTITMVQEFASIMIKKLHNYYMYIMVVSETDLWKDKELITLMINPFMLDNSTMIKDKDLESYPLIIKSN